MNLSYNEKIKYIELFLNKISLNKNIRLLIIFIMHYGLIISNFILYVSTDNIIVYIISLLILIFIFLINVRDNGCFFIKLERKYLGKEWWGPYGIFKYMGIDVNKIFVEKMFTMISVVLIMFSIIKFIYLLSK